MAISGMHPEIGVLIRALGLNPEETRSVVLDMTADEVVTISVEMYATSDQLRKLGDGFKKMKFELHEIKEGMKCEHISICIVHEIPQGKIDGELITQPTKHFVICEACQEVLPIFAVTTKTIIVPLIPDKDGN